MRTAVLLKRNLTYYWRTNLAVVLGVATAVAVLAGALLVGDSVRASLRNLFLQRVGNADHVITAAGFFREQLADDLERHERFASDGFSSACPLIVLDGTITHEESKRRGAGVQVYGVDERFWEFHGQDNAASIAPQNRDVLVSASLAQELEIKANDTLLLRVEKPSAIPAESLHGRREDLGRTIRLSARASLNASALGEFSVRPQQAAVRAVFVPLSLVQKDLEQEGHVNTILVSEKRVGDQSRAKGNSAELLEKILKNSVALEDFGIKLRTLDERRGISLESDSALVGDSLAEVARATASKLKGRTSSILSYLANSIRTEDQREVPYSVVTAIDEESFDELRRGGAATERLGDNSVPASRLTPILLNEWAARDLDVRPGEELSLEYFLWREDGRLQTQTSQFELAGVVPINGIAADRNLVPEYPGITGAESLSNWDPPFPVDLARIRPRDEDYWKQYRTIPKAFIPLERGQELWQSRFGKLTSLRIIPSGDDAQLRSALDSYERELRTALEPSRMGFTSYPARARGEEASRGATDFGEYFLYFSFFIVVSALLLTVLFFKLGIEQRLREIGVLQAIGFPAARIRTLFLSEGLMLATLGSVIGLAGAVAYAHLMMLGLRTWWVGAVGTTMLRLHVSPVSLMLGAVGGVLVALGCIVWTLRRLAASSPRSLLTGGRILGERKATRRHAVGSGQEADGREKIPVVRSPSIGFDLLRRVPAYLFSTPFSTLPLAVACGVLAVALIVAAALNLIGHVAGFFGGGALMLIAALCYQAWQFRRQTRKLIHGSGRWSVARMGFRNATHRPARSILCIALIASAAFIIVSVDAFRRNDKDVVTDKKSGGGGFPFLAESLLPLIHDPNTTEGREALNLTSASDTAALEGMAFTRFRVRPGDDASCLNLYQPRNPKILAPTNDFVNGNRFSFQNSLASSREEKENPWLLLNKELSDNADLIPVIADANSMTYVLHLGLGDELTLNRSDGAPIRLRIVGALADSLFQSELLMSEKNFLRLFPEEQGYRFFLLDAAAHDGSTALTGILEDRLSDFGFDVVPTSERLANFHRVENTFLSTFQMLGGLGLVLGTLGLAAVLWRNVLERRRELALLRAVGYSKSHFALMVIAENALLLFCGLVTGAACAVLAIAPVFFSRGGQLPIASLVLLLLAVIASGLITSLLATVAALRSPLLPALRAE